METLTIIIVAVVAICGICAGYVYSRRMRDRSLADEWRLKYEAERRRADENARRLLAREAGAEEAADGDEKPKASPWTPKEILMQTLAKLGCNPEVDGSRINVKYQGETFVIECGNGQTRCVRIWDPAWVSMNVGDPELPKLRNAINRTNFDWGPTLVLTDPNEENECYVHTKYDIFVNPEIPDMSDFLTSVIGSFFDAKHNLRANYQQLDMTQKAEADKLRKTRRPVGFASSQDPE